MVKCCQPNITQLRSTCIYSNPIGCMSVIVIRIWCMRWYWYAFHYSQFHQSISNNSVSVLHIFSAIFIWFACMCHAYTHKHCIIQIKCEFELNKCWYHAFKCEIYQHFIIKNITSNRGNGCRKLLLPLDHTLNILSHETRQHHIASTFSARYQWMAQVKPNARTQTALVLM